MLSDQHIDLNFTRRAQVFRTDAVAQYDMHEFHGLETKHICGHRTAILNKKHVKSNQYEDLMLSVRRWKKTHTPPNGPIQKWSDKFRRRKMMASSDDEHRLGGGNGRNDQQSTARALRWYRDSGGFTFI